jgi:hypothetical protein
MGVVESVEVGPGYSFREAKHRQQLFLGPASIRLVGGRDLRVPAETLTDDYCPGLLDEAVRTRRRVQPNGRACVVIAQTDGTGAARRLDLQETDESGRVRAGRVHARDGDRFLTGSGYTFAMDVDVSGSCSPRAVGGLDALLSRDGPHQALVDPRTEGIVAIECLPDLGDDVG